ncbi:MAG: hypothetical protein NWE99_10860 [Candidatus Bathyarchaeota archaeon]|nr:hypothetical protein [Candidatus Bathyarchaeota archaeon]
MQRGNLEIIGELLKEITEAPHLAPSRITARAGINYPKLQLLLQAQLATIETKTQKRRRLRLTDKGREYLSHYKALTQIINAN